MRLVLMLGNDAEKNGYLLLKYLLPETLELDILQDENGKPFVQYPVCFNLSHTDGACVMLIDDTDVGVDLERDDRLEQKNSDAFRRHILSVEELEFLIRFGNHSQNLVKLWTRKEAYLKGTGAGITQELKGISTADSSGLRSFVDPFYLTTFHVEGYFISCATIHPCDIQPEILRAEDLTNQKADP